MRVVDTVLMKTLMGPCVRLWSFRPQNKFLRLFINYCVHLNSKKTNDQICFKLFVIKIQQPISLQTPVGTNYIEMYIYLSISININNDRIKTPVNLSFICNANSEDLCWNTKALINVIVMLHILNINIVICFLMSNDSI